MKKQIACFVLIAWIASGFAQVITDHPLKKINKPVEAMEFVIFHTDNSGNGSSPTKSTIGHYDRSLGLNPNQRIVQNDSYTNGTTMNTTGSHSLNVLAVDMNGDGYDEIVEAREQSGSIVINMPDMTKNPLQVTSIGGTEGITTGTVPGGAIPQVKMAKGDFRRNGKQYFAMATPDYALKKIDIYVAYYDSSAGYPTFCGHIYGDSLYYDGNGRPVGNYDITINDFDGDSIPDIALAALEKDGISGYRCYVKTFKVNPAAQDSYLSWTLTAMGKQTIAPVGYDATLENLAISSGIYDSTAAPQNQIAVALAYVDRNDNTLLHKRLFLASTGSGASGLNTITVASSNYSADQSNFNEFPAVAMASGDLNSDDNDEIVLAFDGAMRVFSVSDGPVITPMGSGSGGAVPSGFDQLAANNAYLSIGDVDLDLENDILIVTTNDDGNNLQWFNVTVFGINLSLDSLAIKGEKGDLQQASSSGFSSEYRFAAAFGEFSGGRGLLKAPTHFTRKIFTPLIVNNAAPYHFDILDTLEADIISAFPTFPSGWSSQYKEVTTTSSTVQTTLKSDWGVSGTLSGGGSVLGIGLKASVTAKYGEAFSNVQGSTSTIQISTLSTAASDDQVYGVVSNFDVYEYPVDSSGTTIGYVLAMMRSGTPIVQWMDSKSADASSYIPDHEVGNLLSYASKDNFENFAGDLNTIKTASGYNVGSGGGLNFTMVQTDFTSSSVDTTKTFGLEVSASAEYFGVSLEAKGNYNSSEMTSHTSTAQREVSYISNFNASLNPAFSDANYTVKPYVYWSKSGALTLGYAADPSLPSVGTNFWKDYYYTKPDLTVIMPWKYDPEKGFSLGNTPDKRRLCKSLFFNKTSVITGDTVNIIAFIHNYSLMDYIGDVEFQFYLGDPANGGVLLSDINGQTTITVQDTFPKQGRRPILFQWKVQAGVSPGPRIYIVVDPNNQIDEVHDDNNVGFNVLGGEAITGVENANSNISFEAKLFPNPAANGWTQVQIELPANGKLNAELFDLQGRLIKSLYNDQLQPGHYLLPVSLSEMPQGFYLVKISFNNHQQMLRLVNIK